MCHKGLSWSVGLHPLSRKWIWNAGRKWGCNIHPIKRNKTVGTNIKLIWEIPVIPGSGVSVERTNPVVVTESGNLSADIGNVVPSESRGICGMVGRAKCVTVCVRSAGSGTIRLCHNASTDKTAQICQAYAAKDSRIHYYRNERNLGAAPNYNLVFRQAKGKYKQDLYC